MKVVHKPAEEIVIHNLIELPLKTLGRIATQGCELGSFGATLVWANGILFFHDSMERTDTVHKELIEKNRLHWSNLAWTKMEKHKLILDFGSGVKIPVLNLSSDPIYDRFTKWIKEKHSDE